MASTTDVPGGGTRGVVRRPGATSTGGAAIRVFACAGSATANPPLCFPLNRSWRCNWYLPLLIIPILLYARFS